MTAISSAWGAIRECLQQFSFSDIKRIAGLAGLELAVVAHLVQKQGMTGATKGELMSGIDGAFGKMLDAEQSRFLSILVEEILRRKPEAEELLSDHLSRLGWSFSHGALLPLRLFDPRNLEEIPEESRQSLVKAAQRFRDGDLDGAITAACGAVDSVSSRVYHDKNLGDPAKASFQERCKRAAAAKGVLPAMNERLRLLGWSEQEIVPFRKNFEGALNHGAYVMQTLRAQMGDVHGTKPILKSLVFDSLNWAQLLVGSLLDRPE